MDPDHVDRTITREYEADRPRVPGLAHPSPLWPRPRSTLPVETCLYTIAPDDQFRLDLLPGCPEVIVASPCSGHGFKFSCLIGRVLGRIWPP